MNIGSTAIGIVAALLVVVVPAGAQEQARVDPAWVLEDRDKRVVYSVPGMDEVRPHKDLVYRRVDGAALKMDVYPPRGLAPNQRRPAVILIHGGFLPANLRTEPKEWGQFRSLGRLMAASGFVAVTFNHRFYSSMNSLPDSESDLLALIDHVRLNADRLGLDRDRITLWAFSGSGALLAHALRTSPPYVRAVVVYYAALDLDAGERARPGAIRPDVRRRFSPLRELSERGPLVPPLLVARAGLDRAQINEPMDQFIRLAIEKNADVEVLNHPAGHHGFDIDDDTDRSRQVLSRTIEFIRERNR